MSKADLVLKAIKHLRVLKNSFIQIISTIFLKIYCLLIGVHLGSSIKFFGYSTILRMQNSSIRIGSYCRFRSSVSSNLIGINHRCIIATHRESASIEIGDHCGFSGTVIGAFNKIKIGHNVRCGANTLITDSDWHIDDARVGQSFPVYIEDNVWLGFGVIVLKGVTIGENSIIGAGSVVTKDIPSNVIAAGNPCKILKQLE